MTAAEQRSYGRHGAVQSAAAVAATGVPFRPVRGSTWVKMMEGRALSMWTLHSYDQKVLVMYKQLYMGVSRAR